MDPFKAFFYSLLLFVWSTSNTARGQSWEVFDMNTAGFPSNTVRAIAHDSVGNTWVGTDFGLCRFDGSNWEFFQQSSSDLPESDIRSLAVDGTGRLWVGMFTQGLAVFDGATWIHYAPGAGTFPGQTIREIAFDAEGWAWMATSDGVVHTDLQEWHLYNDTDESYDGLILPGVNIASIAVRDDGLVCIGTLNAGFVYLTDTSVVVYSTAINSLPDNTALGVALDANGDRWAACPFGGLLRNFGDPDGGFWLQYITSNSSIAANSLYDVIVDAADRKIVAFQASGVGFFSGVDDWTFQTTQNSNLPDNEVLRLSLDPTGVLWVGTANGGAARLDYTVSMEEFASSDQGIRVFPVPADDVLFVELPNDRVNEVLSWSVYDVRGAQCATGVWTTSMTVKLDLGSLEPGVHVLQISRKNGSRIARFVVQ